MNTPKIDIPIKEVTLKRGLYGNYKHLVYYIYYGSMQKYSNTYFFAEELASMIDKYIDEGFIVTITTEPENN